MGIPGYHLLIQIKHPTLHPDTISDELGWPGEISQPVGEERYYPNGTKRGGVWPVTYWSSSEELEEGRSFHEHVLELTAFFEGHRDFVVGLIRTGGSVWMTAQLPGDAPFSVEFEAAELARLARLGIELGIESFPHMR